MRNLILIPTIICLSQIISVTEAEAETTEGEHSNAVLFPTGENESHHRNYVAGFAGYTSEERSEGGLTLGAEYSRRVTKHVGVGVVVERVLGDIDSWVGIAAAGLRTEHWKYYGGVGKENPDEGETETLYRVGITYVTPWTHNREWLLTGAVDFVDGEAIWVAGIALGFGF